jgi:hypothetical protein
MTRKSMPPESVPQSMTEIKSPMGKFWCHSHLADMPLSEQSADPRYCQRCFEILREEAKNNKTGDWWVPTTHFTGSPTSRALTGATKSSDPSHYSPPQNVTLICKQCGMVMPFRRKSKDFCGVRCRVAHYRRQKRKVGQV